jgi:hypothetical protein
MRGGLRFTFEGAATPVLLASVIVALATDTSRADGLPPADARPSGPHVQLLRVDKVFDESEVGARPPPGRTRVLVVPRATAPPRIDGVLDDEAWKTAAVGDRFWVVEQQRSPTERTEVLVTSDADNLYVAFRAYDSRPDRIVALDTRTDSSLKQDDQIAVELDPFLSHREVSSYSINARGTISDAIAGGRAAQRKWKGLWTGAATRTDYGWSAEMAIPFSILNFEPGTSTFGVNFLRYHNRTSEWSRWADTTPLDLPEERGRLEGLAPSSHRADSPFTFMPFALAGHNVPNREGDVKKTMASAGIDIRYQPKPNQTGVLSILPDFSQVEDAVNSIDFSYNERFRDDNRPFFQEGSAYFTRKDNKDIQQNYFYTQRVPNFNVGAKLFGRSPGLQYGALATRSSGERTDGVIRVQRELSAAKALGATVVFTDQPDLRNTLVAGDILWRQTSGIYYQADAAVTRTSHGAGDGTFVQGVLGWRSPYWTLSATADQYDLNFLPQLGLLDTDLRDTRGFRGSVSYYRDYTNGTIRELTGYVTSEFRYTDDGRLQRRTNSAGGSVELRKQQIRLGLYYSEGPYRPLRKKTAGAWADTFNDDWYLTSSLDFNTRSKNLHYGASFSTGFLGGGDYEFTSAYVSIRPTATTSLGLSAQQLYSFGRYRQIVLTGGWDVNPKNSLYSRFYTSDGDHYFRLAYVYNMKTNLDVFMVYERQPELKNSISVKLLMTFK